MENVRVLELIGDWDKAVIMKDPNKSIRRMYKVPDDAFEDAKNDETEGDEDEEE